MRHSRRCTADFHKRADTPTRYHSYVNAIGLNPRLTLRFGAAAKYDLLVSGRVNWL